MGEEENEWSLLSDAYDDVLTPRFVPLYEWVANSVVNHIKSNKKEEKYKILDYGTGPGEPMLTLAKLCEENQIFDVVFEGTDSSKGMIAIAKQRLNKLAMTNISVDFNTSTSLPKPDYYDIITSALVLPYMSDKRKLVADFHTSLHHGGLLISCHWPHPSQVSFLSLLKQINTSMATGKHISADDLETDASFSCANEEETRQMFHEQSFLIQEYTLLPIPMSFPDIRTFLSFSRVAPWFKDDNLYSTAENETKRILRQEYGIELGLNEPLRLTSYGTIIVASKQ